MSLILLIQDQGDRSGVMVVHPAAAGGVQPAAVFKALRVGYFIGQAGIRLSRTSLVD
ncbi:hypothetical protein D3C77_596870 [compost metagenome]